MTYLVNYCSISGQYASDAWLINLLRQRFSVCCQPGIYKNYNEESVWRKFWRKVFSLTYVLFNAGKGRVVSSASVYSHLTDNELAKEAKNDLDAFSELFDRFFNRVYQYHFCRIRHREDSEDLTSETFTKIFQKIGQFKEKGVPFSVWVFTVARHTQIDFIRKKKIVIESIDELPPGREPCIDHSTKKIDRQLLSEKIWEALRVLPKKQQDIWALKLSSDLPHKEIARILETTENNVNVSVSRSVKVLKKYLIYLKPDSE